MLNYCNSLHECIMVWIVSIIYEIKKIGRGCKIIFKDIINILYTYCVRSYNHDQVSYIQTLMVRIGFLHYVPSHLAKYI